LVNLAVDKSEIVSTHHNLKSGVSIAGKRVGDKARGQLVLIKLINF